MCRVVNVQQLLSGARHNDRGKERDSSHPDLQNDYDFHYSGDSTSESITISVILEAEAPTALQISQFPACSQGSLSNPLGAASLEEGDLTDVRFTYKKASCWVQKREASSSFG